MQTTLDACEDANRELPELRLQSVAAWALHRMGCIMEDGGIFFTDAQASAFVENHRKNKTCLFFLV